MNVRPDIHFTPDTVTPALTLDFDRINQTYNRFLQAMPTTNIYYAVKANANRDVVQLVVERGGGLEIASLAELRLAQSVGCTPDKIICSNPIKNPMFLQAMHEAGVYAVVVDSSWEVDKVAQHMPGARVYVRLAVDNTGSVIPLSGKFGVDKALALELFDQARDLNLEPIGLSFHVGSQCLSANNWVNAIKACGEVWEEAETRGHEFYFLDIGGGFPAGHYHTPSIPTIEQIGEAVNRAIEQYIPETPNLFLVSEPGRGLVGESGVMVTAVVGQAMRGGDTWLYLDVGVFNGLMESMEGFPPVIEPLVKDEDRPLRRYTLAGPTCDSFDVFARNIDLPELHIGDKIIILDQGAYATEYAVPFNGFPTPEVQPIGLEMPEMA